MQLVGQAIMPAADIPVGDLRVQTNSANFGCVRLRSLLCGAAKPPFWPGLGTR
jgi:hypothetical protein